MSPAETHTRQATTTAFDPCPPAGVPAVNFRDTRDLYCLAPGRCNHDELAPSKSNIYY
jgi:hypothetical protein